MTDEMLQARLGDLAGAVGKLKNNSRSVAAKEDIRKILIVYFIFSEEEKRCFSVYWLCLQ